MVMEASPSPQSVGREFVRQYYTLLNKAPSHLHRFYNNYSSFVHGGLDAPNRETPPVIGQKQIHNRIQQLNFRDCHAKISQVDSQATLGNGVVVQVTGELSNGGAPMRRFTQTFVLAAQSPKKYYVHNDIFRYQDIVLSDEEGEGSTRSEGEDEETRGYFPPPPTAFPTGGFPPAPMPPAHPHVPPAAPLAPTAPPVPPPTAAPAPAPASVPAQTPHLNGHPAAPPLHDDSIRHLGATLQATSISSGPEVESMNAVDSENASTPLMPPEPEPEPEPEREPTPPPQTAAPPVPPEPKTYANLLKSGGPPAHAQPAHTRSSPPQSGTAVSGGGTPGGAAVAGSVAGAEAPRPRPQRPPRDVQPPPDGPSSGASAGIGGNTGAGGATGASNSARRYSDSHQLFLGNLPHNATEEELRALFGRFGAIAELRVHSKPATAGGARHPNYGFITYEQPQAAHNCLHAAPLYFPPDAPDAVKLNVEEKKARGGRAEAPRGGRGAARGPPSHRPPFPSRPPYRR